jgi:ribosomal protein L36
MNNICRNTVVDKLHYYSDNELESLRKFVLDYAIIRREQKLSIINSKIQRFKRKT